MTAEPTKLLPTEMSSVSRPYILTHVVRINRATSQQFKLDCLWRIASCADIYPRAVLNAFKDAEMPAVMQAEIVTWLQANGFEITL